jgi:hypothetical protein
VDKHRRPWIQSLARGLLSRGARDSFATPVREKVLVGPPAASKKGDAVTLLLA